MVSKAESDLPSSRKIRVTVLGKRIVMPNLLFPTAVHSHRPIESTTTPKHTTN